ncbi:hypothetical protein F5X68DRAFT_24535 [Plectosphaerella plurivora]|uniref:Uncharacterized protein n=1 Tax=Plectosphaerella plurivora TaxID=936078 RepID=A0A9P8V929_9PEZI|nr:hypothetical protein F5X68DRAFT_24535 [Plectosphaerella plurivora]
MDKLSPEIIDKILDHLREDCYRTYGSKPFVALYAPLAAISRPWQYVVESKSFRQIDIEGTPEGIAKFAAAFSKPWRQSALRGLVLGIPYFCSCELRDIDPACQHKRDAYVGAMTALYRSMENWGPIGGGLVPNQPRVYLQVEMLPSPGRGYIISEHLRFPEKNLALWQGSEAARWISRLHTRNTLDFVASCQLPSLLSNLQSLQLKLPSYQGSGELAIYGDKYLLNLHKTLTEALLDARTSLPRLQTLWIHMGLEENGGDLSPGVDLRNADGVDELCEAIRLLGQTVPLRNLTLRWILVTPDLFQDCRLPAGEHDTATWPLLEELHITFPAVAPSGEWYTKNDPELYRGLYNFDQTQLDGNDGWYPAIGTATFNPLQEAFARGLLRMPALRLASLVLDYSDGRLCVTAVDRPRGREGRMKMSETEWWRSYERGWEPEWAGMTKEAWKALDGDELVAAEAAIIKKRKEWKERQEAQRALLMKDRAIEIDAQFAGGLPHLDQEISQRRLWDPLMFGKDAIWQPTPEIAHLWNRWVTWEGRGTW